MNVCICQEILDIWTFDCGTDARVVHLLQLCHFKIWTAYAQALDEGLPSIQQVNWSTGQPFGSSQIYLLASCLVLEGAYSSFCFKTIHEGVLRLRART